MNIKSKVVLFADGTSIVVTSPHHIDFIYVIKPVFEYANEWFNINFLSLNFGKSHYM